jgi:hypothetical protein
MMVVTLNTGATMRKCVDMTYLLSYLVIVFPIYLLHEGQLTTGQLVKFWACRYYHLSGRHVAPGWIAVYELLLYYNTINPSRSLYCYSLKLSMSQLMAKVMLSTQENPQNPRSQTWERQEEFTYSFGIFCLCSMRSILKFLLILHFIHSQFKTG